MTTFFYQNEPWISPQQLLEFLRSGEVGEWWVDGLGPLVVRGEARLGRLLIAHGAGAGQDSVFLEQLRHALAEAGVQTLAMEFAYLQQMRREARRRPPPRIDRLVDELARWCDTVSHNDLPPLWVGGKSMGGRAASLLTARDAAAGLVLCGYPFHPAGKPDTLRLSHWPLIGCPTIVVQGTRDPFGNQDEVSGYSLPDGVALHWLEDGDHDWKPRRSSGRVQLDLIQEGAEAIASFMARMS